MDSTRVSRVEWVWVLAASIAIFLFSSIPYLAGYQAQTIDQVFNGAVYDRQDYAVHLATMRIGQRGEWAYSMRFTSEDQPGAYIKLGYIFLGHVAGWLGLSLPLSYQLARFFSSLLASFLIYRLAAHVFVEPGWRFAVFFLAILGAGAGWLQSSSGWLPVADISPIDFWLVDGYIFFGMMALPHMTAVTALMTGMLLSGLSYLQAPRWWKLGAAGFCAVLIQFIQPYAPLLPDAALTGMVGLTIWKSHRLDRRWLLFLGGLALIQLPLLGYNLLILGSDPFWVNFVAQNITLSPPPIYYILGYALFWPLALWGTVRLVSQVIAPTPVNQPIPSDKIVKIGALIWILAALILAYVPYNLQRRFMQAFTIPLAILAISGLRDGLFPWVERFAPAWIRVRKNLIPVLVVALASISSLVLSLGNAAYAASRPATLFDPGAVVRAVDWISRQVVEQDVILASEQNSQLAAARTSARVYFGHPIETLNYPEKVQAFQDFLADKKSGAWLVGVGIRWVLLGPGEVGEPPQALRQQANQVYDQDGVQVWQVHP